MDEKEKERESGRRTDHTELVGAMVEVQGRRIPYTGLKSPIPKRPLPMTITNKGLVGAWRKITFENKMTQ